MAKKRPEQIIYELKERVAKEFLAEVSPLKRFPEDFLSAKVKKELAVRISQPCTFEPGIKITGRYHQLRRPKIDMKKVRAMCAYFKAVKEKTTAFAPPAADKLRHSTSADKSANKYEEVPLPTGKLKLNVGRKFEICFENGMVLLEFDSFERAKYILYARKEGQVIYKVPKSEIVVKRAVQAYEKYLKEIRDKLIKAFVKKGADREAAEGLTKQALSDFGF